MANRLYDGGRERWLGGDMDWDADTFKLTLCDGADYSPNTSTDDFYDDVPSGARVADSAALSGKTKTAGVADCNDVTWSAVTGDQSELVVLRKDTGTASTSALGALWDTATGLPVTPNGGDIIFSVDNGSNRLLKL